MADEMLINAKEKRHELENAWVEKIQSTRNLQMSTKGLWTHLCSLKVIAIATRASKPPKTSGDLKKIAMLLQVISSALQKKMKKIKSEPAAGRTKAFF